MSLASYMSTSTSSSLVCSNKHFFLLSLCDVVILQDPAAVSSLLQQIKTKVFEVSGIFIY
jgi:hypothetical protein